MFKHRNGEIRETTKGTEQHLPSLWLFSTTMLRLDLITNRVALFEIEDKTADIPIKADYQAAAEYGFVLLINTM